ncbi:TetR/AcrR family transcriptional regulator [Pseudonocardiaceae bacterium YIM PH 21723]|nr:TetR/AcrR family transcriptional regulator [Pseudonocardiaceae bacterium YIM PH 21723]
MSEVPEDLLATSDDRVDATQRKILDAARTEFEAFGLRRVSMEDVAKRAGVHRVTVYRRFDSKNTLFNAVITQRLQEYLVELDARLDATEGGLAEEFAEAFVFAMHFARTDPLITRLLASEPETILPVVTMDSEALMGIAVTILAERLRNHPDAAGWPAAEPEIVAELAIRIGLSHAFNPHSVASLATEEELRDYGRRYLTRLLP